MKFDDEVAKKLDAVVGESYAPPRSWHATIAKWIAALALAIGMSALIWSILDKYTTKAKVDAAAKRPVQVHILPPKQ